MKRVGIKAQVGYRSPRARKGEASIVSPNRLQRQFNPDAPDERWVTDITYIRTREGWLYLAMVVDLFSRKIIGWSMQSRMTKDIVLNALLMAIWRRNPQKQVLVHSDQGSQYTSHEWQSFLKSHGLEGSMSRRGNCHDNAVAESFFQLLKRERIKKKIYGTREEARSDIFDYIEMFYNSKRRHGSSDQMSPTEYENQYYQRLGSVWIIRGDSNNMVLVIPLRVILKKLISSIRDKASIKLRKKLVIILKKAISSLWMVYTRIISKFLINEETSGLF